MVIVAASGVLQTTGLPFFLAIGQIAQNLAAARYDARKLREKAAMPLVQTIRNGPASQQRSTDGSHQQA